MQFYVNCTTLYICCLYCILLYRSLGSLTYFVCSDLRVVTYDWEVQWVSQSVSLPQRDEELWQAVYTCASSDCAPTLIVCVEYGSFHRLLRHTLTRLWFKSGPLQTASPPRRRSYQDASPLNLWNTGSRNILNQIKGSSLHRRINHSFASSLHNSFSPMLDSSNEPTS